MSLDQSLVLFVLVASFVLFLWGRWRYDVVALSGLLFLGITGVIPADRLFDGFSSPAVITVGAILILSSAIGRSGFVDILAERVLRFGGDSPTRQVFLLVTLAILCSSFMNNVGALALLLPVALKVSEQTGISPSKLLMPLAFASLLGGMTTLIGTPPNIIVSGFRAEHLGESYRLFDFGFAGLAIVAVGLLYLPLLGWRLIPERSSPNTGDRFDLGQYVTEFLVPPESDFVGRRVLELRPPATAGEDLPDFLVLSIVSHGERAALPNPHRILEAGDRLQIEIDPSDVSALVERTGLTLSGANAVPLETVNQQPYSLETESVALVEALVLPTSRLAGRTMRQLNLRRLFGIGLAGVSRRGRAVHSPLADLKILPFDLILLQCERPKLEELPELGLLSLARHERITLSPRRLFLTLGIFAGAILMLLLGQWSAAMAFSIAAVLVVLSGLIPIEEIYHSVDATVIVLLAALIPVGQAFEDTGAAAALASSLTGLVSGLPPVVVLAAVMVVTMMLSDIMNNAATAVVMAPIGLAMAQELGMAADPFLMAVAIGASSAFLTPVGHQSNLLVVSPGGYRFSDFWRPGSILEILIVVVTCPILLRVWG
jgi:di/tricarboxylate transporter